MKKGVLILAAGMVFTGASCGSTGKAVKNDREQSTITPVPNPGSGVEMKVYPERNGGAPRTLQLTLTNTTDQTIQFGAHYTVERSVDGVWQLVDLGNVAVIAIMYQLRPGETGTYTVGLFPERTAYPEADYRLVKEIRIGEESRAYYAPFKIITPR